MKTHAASTNQRRSAMITRISSAQSKTLVPSLCSMKCRNPRSQLARLAVTCVIASAVSACSSSGTGGISGSQRQAGAGGSVGQTGIGGANTNGGAARRAAATRTEAAVRLPTVEGRAHRRAAVADRRVVELRATLLPRPSRKHGNKTRSNRLPFFGSQRHVASRAVMTSRRT